MMKLLAGDYDGDLVTLTPITGLKLFGALVATALAPGNAKLLKTFTKDSGDGAPGLDKLIQLMEGKLVESAAGLARRFHSLTTRSLLHVWKQRWTDSGPAFQGLSTVMGASLDPPIDASKLMALGTVLGLKKDNEPTPFDPKNAEHALAYMNRELELLNKGGTDQEKMKLDYDLFDACRNWYEEALGSDPSVPIGVPYSKA